MTERAADVPGFHFLCLVCSRTYGGSEDLLVCPRCAADQEPGGPTSGVLEIVLDRLPGAWPAAVESPSFLPPFLPLAERGPKPPISVGATPLRAPRRLRDHLGLPNLWLKDDTKNPSGSTKDRASWLVAARAMELGYQTIATASTGNAASALACVAAASPGLQAVTMVPASTPQAKLDQMRAYGARVLPVDGTYDQAFELCLAACEHFGWYNRNTALNPFTTEGKKSVAIEVAAQLAPEEASVVLVPTGDGVIISGVAKGFADLERAGLIHRRPRLIAVQPEGSSALVRAWRDGGWSASSGHPGAASVADSLVVEMPRGAVPALRALDESQGAGVTVSDAEILEACDLLARTTGVRAEPAAAAALAGLLTAREQDLVSTDESVVLMITGARDKPMPAVRQETPLPSPVSPSLEALRSHLAARGESRDGHAHGSCGLDARREERGDAGHRRRRATPKPAHNPHAPRGLRRQGPIFRVTAPRR